MDRSERGGARRAVALLQLFERAQGDADLALDLRRAIHSLSEDARGYLELLVGEGAMADEVAAGKLELDAKALDRALAEIDAKIAPLIEGGRY